MSEGRTLVFPRALLFGARPLTVPGRGAVLCASAGLPLRLSDGAPVKPNDYYAAVSAYAGKMAIPDAMAPLPGAELIVLGPVERPEAPRKASIRCGAIACRLLLHPDPDALADSPFTGCAEDAAWHAQHNPVGRGGPEDERQPLIVQEDRPEDPVWLGATPFEHPARTRLAGTSETIRNGWPSDADAAVLFEAHPALRTRSLHAGDELEIEGLGADQVRLALPPYRAVMATSRAPSGKWHQETARIHTVVAIPAADIGAVFWRAAVELGDDLLGEKIIALVVALEDIDAAEKDAEDLGIIAAERWLEPTKAQDDRPLLPAAMAAAAAPPPAPDAAEQAARQEAAEDWARKEFGAEAVNPFADPDAVAKADAAAEAAEDGEPPDLDEIDSIGREAMAASQRRHAEAGFEPPDPDAPRPPSERGEALDAEARERLARPYRAPREVALASALAQAPPEAGVDVEDNLTRLGNGRLLATTPVLSWPAFTEAEAARFGDAVLRQFAAADPERHIDVSGAHVGAAPTGLAAQGTATSARRSITGRVFEGLLAEETQWRDVEFADCTFREVTFVKGVFERCVFRRCRLERVNFSSATLQDVTFSHCTLREQAAEGCNAVGLRFEECELASLTFVDLAIRDSLFDGGSWSEIEFSDSLLVRVAMRDTRMTQVTYSMCHAPECRFERTPMHKVWVMGQGFAGCFFDGVEADTCGFLGNAHFQQTRFERTRFEQTGFSNAKFNDAEFGPECVFTRCDLSGALFQGVRAPGVRFLECTLPMSKWEKADATDAWFMDTMLRAVDFSQTTLMNAVFVGSDLEGVVFDDRLILGADFRGTVRAS